MTVGRRISAYLRASVSLAREIERIGPFMASFSPEGDNRFLNYAIPDDDAEPTVADLSELTDAFRRRERAPRLEYVPAAAPAVEKSLLNAGWAEEGRLPLMILPSHAAIDGGLPADVELVAPVTDLELLATVAAQNEAYGGDPPGPDEGPALRRTIVAGGRVVLARVAGGGEPIGGGLFVAPQGGVAEISGIGVRERFRRRGVATAMVRWLALEARANGATTVFLMAATAAEERIYARIGFETVGEVLHIGFTRP